MKQRVHHETFDIVKVTEEVIERLKCTEGIIVDR